MWLNNVARGVRHPNAGGGLLYTALHGEGERDRRSFPNPKPPGVVCSMSNYTAARNGLTGMQESCHHKFRGRRIE